MAAPDPLSQFILGLATSLATELIKAGAGFLARKLFDSPQQNALQAIWTRTFYSLLSRSPNPQYPPELETLLRHFITTASTADQLLGLTLRMRQPDVPGLRRQFESSDSYYDPAAFLETYQITFDDLLHHLLTALGESVADEINNLNSPLQSYLTVIKVDEILNTVKGQSPVPVAPYIPPPLPPPDFLPPPSSLPPGSRLPFPRNAAFTGRQADLKTLAADLLFSSSSALAAIVDAAALSGSGGIGKTQLAVEFCYRYGQFFYGVHWLQADQELNPQIALCGREMDLKPWPETPPEQVTVTLAAWQRQPHRLVVLDNLLDPRLLIDLPDELCATRLLVTSRRAEYDLTLGVRTHLLELLPRSDSLVLLRKLAPRLLHEPDSALDPLAKRLGDYPLALHLAGLYLNKVRFVSPRSYLERLDQPGQSLEQDFLEEWKKTNPTHYEWNAGQAFRLSWNQLEADHSIDALARRFFLAAGYCATNTPVPVEIFRQLAGEAIDDLMVASALDRLQELGLASPSDTGPLLHPLLAEFARLQDSTDPESALPALVDALAAVSNQVSRLGAVTGYLPLLPHLRQAGEHCLPSLPEQAALMYNNLGALLDSMGDYPAARPYYEQALAIWREVLGEKHPDTARSLNNLGYLLQAMGDYPAARPYYEQALAILESTLGPDHPNTQTVRRNLASLNAQS